MVHPVVELLSSGRNYSCVFTRPACQGTASTKEVAVENLKENSCSFMEISTNISIGFFAAYRWELLALSLNRNFTGKD